MADLKKIYTAIEAESFPEILTISFGNHKFVYRKRVWEVDGKEKGLRYGENPHQPAALYQLVEGSAEMAGINWRSAADALVSGLTSAQMIQAGKHPGKTNLTDVDNGANILQYLTEKPACVILKHNNPCGAAWADQAEGGIRQAFWKAFQCDRIAAFGGAIVVNSPLDKDVCHLISEQYFEVVAAPAFEEGALSELARRKNLRILELPRLASLENLRSTSWLDFKSLSDGGLIVQQSWHTAILDDAAFLPATATTKDGITVTAKRPDKKQLDDLRFAWGVEAGVTSNSVIFAKNGATVAIGTGEQDRVGCVELAVYKAYAKYADWLSFTETGNSLYELRLKAAADPGVANLLADIESRTGSAKAGLLKSRLVSDGFFPFRDGVDVAINQGVDAIAQPGGSIRDAEVIMACNEAVPQVAMVFTGERSFRH